MKKSAVLRTLAAGAGLVALTAQGAVSASEETPPTVVSQDAVDWTPDLVPVTGQAKPVAYGITEAGGQMVVGGRFGKVEDNSSPGVDELDRQNVVAFNATTGAVSAGFAPTVNGQVWSVESDGTSVYIGGAFTTVNGTSRPALAKLNLATGALDPNFNAGFPGGRVTDMELHNGKLFVSGTFRAKLAALDPATGKSSYTIPSVNGRLPNSDSAQVFKFDISPAAKKLVAVGNFTSVGPDNEPRPRVFMLDLGATSATLSPWNYEPLAEPCTSTRTNAIAYVQDVDFSQDGSYFALAAFGYMYQGYDTPINDPRNRRWFQICDSVSRFETNNLDPQQPTWINYTGGDSLKSVAVTKDAIYVQGHSRWLDSPYGRDSADEFAVNRLGGGAVDPIARGSARVGDLKAVPGKALDWNPVMPQQSGGYQILPTQAGVWFVTDGARFGGEYHRGIRFAPAS